MSDKKQMACQFFTGRETPNGYDYDEMEIDYGLIEVKVKELNKIGVDITLQEIGDIIETKFSGKPVKADLQRRKEVGRENELMYPQYTLLRRTQQ